MTTKLLDAFALPVLGLTGLIVICGLFAFMVVAWGWQEERALLWHAGAGRVVLSWTAYRVLKVLHEPDGEEALEFTSR